MSVSFANAVADGLRHNGVTVHYIDGWDRRGNGQTSDYRGMIWHHTASGYGFAPSILWNGRSDLSGPLCNTSGNADGSVTVVAAHPANHAGASGGRSMGPLPVTNTFNKYVWGHEIVYPGTQPMTDAQKRTALVLAGVISGILGRPSPDWARGHAETSITGKWDPGFAEGRTYDLNAFRAGVWGALNSEVDDMTPEQDAMLRAVHHEMTYRLANRRGPDGTNRKVGFRDDTTLGYAANADGYGFRTEATLAELVGMVRDLAAEVKSLKSNKTV